MDAKRRRGSFCMHDPTRSFNSTYYLLMLRQWRLYNHSRSAVFNFRGILAARRYQHLCKEVHGGQSGNLAISHTIRQVPGLTYVLLADEGVLMSSRIRSLLLHCTNSTDERTSTIGTYY